MTGGPDDGAPPPPDPMGELAEGAVQMHVLFSEYVRAGFTETQAMQFLVALLQRPNE